MSASDAAPLPRLGEVFFDVRGKSRSMRLSWYADTGIAVFSIWQGGVCTGTFRLPIDDLPRMVDTLQRGPQGRRPRPAPAIEGPQGGSRPVPAGEGPRGGSRPVPAGEAPYGGSPPVPVGEDPYGGSRPVRAEGDPYGETAALSQPGYPERPDYQSGTYSGDDDYLPAGDYDPDADFGTEYDYPPPEGEQFIDSAEGSDYGQERFVPPYVRGQGEGYPIDNPADETEFRGDYGQPAFRPDRQPRPSGPDPYAEPSGPSDGYSDDPRDTDSRRHAYSAAQRRASARGAYGRSEHAEPGLNRAGRRDYRGQRER